MSIEHELTSLAERTLEEHLAPIMELHAIHDLVNSFIKRYRDDHKSLDAECKNCIEAFQLAVECVDDNLPSLDKLHADLTEQLMEERGNVERYSGDEG